MDYLSSVISFNNSNLYFSKYELSKIFSCYSWGVSKGSWKDYAINFGKQKTSFYMFKHSLASPDCILTKSKKNKIDFIFYGLEFQNKKETKFSKIDDLISYLKRREIKII